MTVSLEAHPLMYAQGGYIKSGIVRKVILQGGVIGAWMPHEFKSARRKFEDGVLAVLLLDLPG